MKKRKNLTPKEVKWKEVKKKYRLSLRHIEMAKKLNMNPKKFGSIANHKQQPWKDPLPQFIERIYFKRFKEKSPPNNS
ncbi:MAG: hypothetical protein KDK61_04540 [Simkania sp.]|nr:hypothetical protein [Simkania sp.]MCB9092832.1 hypothetical protein [Halobacteriovoraceae bacterium]